MLTTDASLDMNALRVAFVGRQWGVVIELCKQLLQSTHQLARYDVMQRLAAAYFSSGDRSTGARQLEETWCYAREADLRLGVGHLLKLGYMAERFGNVPLALEVVSSLPGPVVTPFDSAIIERRLRAAQGYRMALAGKVARVIPLGQECLAFALMSRWGFGEVAVDGPFTAGVFTGDAPALAMSDDFAAFLDPECYTIVHTPSGWDTPVIRRYSTLLNHETGPYFCAGALRPLVRLYTRRVDNLRSTIARGGPILFIVELTPLSRLAALVAAVDAKYPGLNCRFVLIDGEDADRSDDPVWADPRLRVIAAPRDIEGYVWQDPVHFNTQQGFEWEAGIATALAHEIAGTP